MVSLASQQPTSPGSKDTVPCDIKFRASWNDVSDARRHSVSLPTHLFYLPIFHGSQPNPPMGICCSTLTSFTLTSSYLATTNGRPVSVTFHPLQQIPTSLPPRNDIPPSKPSLFRHRRWRRAHPTVSITTQSPEPGGENPPRARSQDPHRDKSPRSPSPFRSNVPTSLPHSRPSPALSTPPKPYQSKGRRSSPLTRSRSVDAPSHQGSAPPSPHGITRVASTSSLDGRRPHRPNVETVLSQDDLQPAPWTIQIPVPANGSDERQSLESTLESILHDDSRYSVGRYLIVITNSTVHRFNIVVFGEVCDSCLTSPR